MRILFRNYQPKCNPLAMLSWIEYNSVTCIYC